MATSAPTYESIVTKHALGAILADGDLQLTADGDVAVAADGDLRFGNDKCNAMHRLVVSWCSNARILQSLFTLVAQEGERMQEAEAERGVIAGILFTNRALIEKYHLLNDEIVAGASGGAACAGAIMIVMSNMLLRYRHDLKPTNPKWTKIEPQFGAYSFGEVVVAAAANFRHHDEWARTAKPAEQQQKSIKVIKGLVRDSSLSSAWKRNVCADLVPVIGGDDFVTLEDRFFEFAKAMIA